MSVFISYSSKDFEFVKKLSVELVKNRIQIWLDKWEMQPGDSLLDKIQEGITEASFLLVVLSKNSIESPWCKKELNSGLIRELEEKKVVIIPIIIDNCEIPLFLKEKVYADFRDDFETGFQSLLRPLSKLFSEHIGRKTESDSIIDYAINWGIEDFLYFLAIDLVAWHPKQKKTILLQIKAKGNESATMHYVDQATRGIDWLMKETLILSLSETDEYKNMPIYLSADEVFNQYGELRDSKSDLNFHIHIRGVLMGEDTGNDQLIHLADFLEMLVSSSKERVKAKSKF